jgi:hypothetical protein
MGFEVLSERLAEIARNLDEQFPTTIAMQSMIEVEAEFKDRVFAKGLKTDGSPIGTYSTKPSYFDKDSFIRKASYKPQGKVNKGKFKNGNQRKSMYLAQGYNQFRDIQGRETPNINLKYSGSEERALRVYKFGSEVLFGNADKTEHIKIESQDEKYGTIFSLSVAEGEFLKQAIVDKVIIVAKK